MPITLTTTTFVNARSVEVVRAYAARHSLQGNYCIGRMADAPADPTVYFYPCLSDGETRDYAKARQKQLPDANGKLMNIRGLDKLVREMCK